MLTQVEIDKRMKAYLGRPEGNAKRPAVIHLHERYGIVQDTSDLGHKLVDAGYVVLVPDLFSRFTGDRQALTRGDVQVELSDEEALQDLDTSISYFRNLTDVEGSRIAMIGVCQTGRAAFNVSQAGMIWPESSCYTEPYIRLIGSLTRSARNR
jgi:carboxymethylenebutenolidase